MIGLDVRFHAPDGADGNNLSDAKGLERVDVRTIIDHGGIDPMATPMTREKGDAPAGQRAEGHGIRRSTKGRGHANFPNPLQVLHLI